MEVSKSSADFSGRVTVQQLDRLANVGWSERERRALESEHERQMRNNGLLGALPDEQVEIVRRRVYGDSYRLSEGMGIALGEEAFTGERHRVIRMELTRIAFDAARWLECRDVVYTRQLSNTLASVTNTYQFLWDDTQVKHARHHIQVADRFGRTGEMAQLYYVHDNLAVHDDPATLGMLSLEDRFGEVSTGECAQLTEMLDGYYTRVREQSR